MYTPVKNSVQEKVSDTYDNDSHTILKFSKSYPLGDGMAKWEHRIQSNN